MQKYQWLLAGLLAVGIGGCATMEGKWSLAKVNPTAARRDFAFTSITLQKDGTFYAEAEEMGDTESVSGTWILDNDLLILKEQDGERHSFDAHLKGNELQLVRHWNGQRLTAVMVKRDT